MERIKIWWSYQNHSGRGLEICSIFGALTTVAQWWSPRLQTAATSSLGFIEDHQDLGRGQYQPIRARGFSALSNEKRDTICLIHRNHRYTISCQFAVWKQGPSQYERYMLLLRSHTLRLMCPRVGREMYKGRVVWSMKGREDGSVVVISSS